MTQVVATVDGVDPNPLVWVTVAEAGRRQNPPVSRQAASKRIAALELAGRLTTRKGPGGTKLVNIVQYLRAVEDETDPAQALRNARTTTTTPLPARSPISVDPDDDDDEGDGLETGKPNYHRSRAEREAYQAENARLDLLERNNAILDREDVDRRTMTAFRKVRDRMLGLPAAWAEKLAAAPDARALKVMLQNAMRKELEALAAELDHLGESEDDAAGDDAEGGDGTDAAD